MAQMHSSLPALLGSLVELYLKRYGKPRFAAESEVLVWDKKEWTRGIIKRGSGIAKRYEEVRLGGWDSRRQVPEKDVLAVPASSMGVLLLTAAASGEEFLVGGDDRLAVGE